jgi:hypothetical protein
MAVIAGMVTTHPVHAIAVGLELSLIINVSDQRVNDVQYRQQVAGYAAAFQDQDVVKRILSTPNGVAVNVLQFSDTPTDPIGWRLLKTGTDIESFAKEIGAMQRSPGTEKTAITSAIALAIDLFDNGFEGASKIIDLSAPWYDDVGAGCTIRGCASLQSIVKEAQDQGFVINGLPILDALGDDLAAYFTNNVITGGAFIQSAASFDDFEKASTLKLLRELGGGGGDQVPEPGTLALLAAAALAGWRLRRPFE